MTNNTEFKTGQALCDMLANFYATLRPNTFAALLKGAIQPLSGDEMPKTQWDVAVDHYMLYLLQQAGGLTNYSINKENYAFTQYIAEFSTAFLKTIFDAIVVPENVVTSVTSFINGVGKSLRASWDDKSKDYMIGLLGQCHEAVQESRDSSTHRYFPKIKYYYLRVSSSQTEFTTPCVSTKTITFNFQYESYVTAIAADALDEKSSAYKKFHDFISRAQEVNHQNAENNLDAILGGTTSRPPGTANVFGAELSRYPVLTGPSTPIQSGWRLIPSATRIPESNPDSGLQGKGRVVNLTNVYVNVAGTGENVLKDGTGECDSAVITASGTVVGNGPREGGKYVLGSSQKIYYDVMCIGFKNGYGSFKLRPGDTC